MTTLATKINPINLDPSEGPPTARSDQSSIFSAVAPPTMVVAGYEVYEMLGRGGMGVVYKARQVGLNRLVALKMVLAGRMASFDELARFRREAEAVAALNHPNIVRVYEVGEHQGTPFFSLEYISGGTLGRLLAQQGALSPKLAAQLAEAIARGAHEAHRHGIIHRDLKPANILLEQEEPETETELGQGLVQSRSPRIGTPKITDFGIAKRLNETQALTETGAAAGTPQYMAPEQAMADKNRPLTGQADVYAMGVILYEMLTQQRPFDGDNPIEIIQRMMTQNPPTPTRFNPKIPRDLETIVLKCLEKNPNHRYATAQALADELARWLAGKPIHARPVSKWEQGLRWCRRNPVVAGLLAGIFVVLSMGIMASSTLAIRANKAAKAAEESATAADADKVAAQTASDKARESARIAAINEANANAAKQVESELRLQSVERERIRNQELYAADMNIAHTDWHAGRLLNSMQLLRKYRPNQPTDSPNAFEWHYLHRLCTAFDKLHQTREPIINLVPMANPNTVVLMHPDNTATLFQISPPMYLGLWSTATSSYPLRTIEFSSTGTFACLFDGPLLQVYHEKKLSKKLHELRLHEDQACRAQKVVFTPDGKTMYVAIGSSQKWMLPGVIVAYDVATGKEIRRFEGSKASVNDIALSSHGQTLYSVDHHGAVVVWDTATGKPVRTGTVGCTALSVAISPNGEKIAVGTGIGEVYLLGSSTLQVLRTMEGSLGFVRQVSFAADSNSLASRSYDNYVHVWRADDGTLLRRCRGHTDTVTGFLFDTRDHSKLLSVGKDGQVIRWDVSKSLEAVTNLNPQVNTANLIRMKDPRTMLFVDGLLGFSRLDLTTNTLGKQQSIFNNQGNSTHKVVSPDETQMAISIVGGQIYTLSLTDPEAKPVLLSDRCPRTWRMAYSPDGKTIVAVTQNGMIHYLPADGKGPVHQVYASDQPFNGVHFIPGQPTTFVTVGNTGKVHRWDLLTRKYLGSLYENESNLHAIAFTADGQRFVVGRGDGVVVLCETATGHVLRQFHGHTKQVNSVMFDPTEKRLITSSNDMTARLWDVETARTTLTLDAHRTHVMDAMFSSDGEKIVTMGTYGVNVWDASPSYEVERGRLLVLGTHLTNAQATVNGKQIEGTFQLINATKKALPVPKNQRLLTFAVELEQRPNRNEGRFKLPKQPLVVTVDTLAVDGSTTWTFRTPIRDTWPAGEYTIYIKHQWGEEPANIRGQATCKLTIPPK